MQTTFGIGEVARLTGVRVSAIRYYEARGLVGPEARRGGKRVYGTKSVERLALIVYAKNLGLSLLQIRKLLDGFAAETPAGPRWSQLAKEKLEALDALSRRIDEMRSALQNIARCRCRDLDECAHA